MIFGAHVIVYSQDAAADRAFFSDVLGFPSVDAGHGWLIFALPAAEAAVHPAEGDDRHELYFMCDDLKAEISALGEKGVRCSDVQEPDGVRSPGSGSPAAARLVSTSPSTQPPWPSPRTDPRTRRH